MSAVREERWVNGPKLIRVVKSALRDTRDKSERDTLVIRRIENYLARQPVQPPLVGVTEAARLLKVPKPRIIRFRQQGRLPEPLEVAGPSAPVYIKDEIETFARTVEQGREERRMKAVA